MSDSSVAYYRRLFEYERDSNAKLLASLETVPVPRRDSAEYRRALDLHAHIAASRLMWLFRLGAESRAPESYTPNGLSLTEVTALMARMESGWSRYLGGLSEGDMDQPLEYASVSSGRFRSTKSEIFTHLAGHGWYHRGQISALIRAAGGTPPMTDFMFWSRTPLEG
jgi:uncharacterized damage-inducible protein DinB